MLRAPILCRSVSPWGAPGMVFGARVDAEGPPRMDGLSGLAVVTAS